MLHPDLQNVLGWSYDIFGNYASPMACKRKIVDVSILETHEATIGNVNYDIPTSSLVSVHRLEEVVGFNHEGESLYQYGSSLKNNLGLSGGFKLFKASTELTFGRENESFASHRFSATDYIHRLGDFRLQIDNPATWMQSPEGHRLITENFREDLMNMDPVRFYETYGTFFVKAITVGGRCNLTYSASKNSEVTKQSLRSKSNASFSLLKLFSAEGGYDRQWQETIRNENQETKFHFYAIGGQAEQIGRDPANWRVTVRGNPVVVELNPGTDAVIPLYDFVPYWINDISRRRFIELKETFKQLMDQNRIPRIYDPVTVYEYPYFSGAQKELHIGEYSHLNNLIGTNRHWANDIDSVQIPDGVVVTAWEYPEFARRKYGPFRGPKSIHEVIGQNNWDSIKVQESKDVPPFVEIFAYGNCDYSRKCTVLFEGEYPRLTNINTDNWANEVDSIIIPDGFTVMAWEYPDYTGIMWGPFIGPKRINSVPGINNWDSIKIIKSELVPLFVRVFQYPDWNTSRRYTALFVGDYPNLSERIQGIGPNDIDSIDIPLGATITAWSHPNFRGRQYGPFAGPTRINRVPGINDWDSIQIRETQ